MEGGVHALQGVFRAAGDAHVLCLVNPPVSSSACGQAMVIPGARRMCMCCPNLCPFRWSSLNSQQLPQQLTDPT